ncbi:MAG: hypothetical protein ACI9RM_002592, partial [Ulvibacter sp.]
KNTIPCVFWILLIGFSECPTTEVYLETQAGLDNFVANYPNPVSELLKVDVSEGIVLESIVVFSILGQQLINSKNNILDFSSLSQGVYFV